MGINFSAFEIGRRALHAAQLGLTVAGQNIANVNTAGYTRQSVLLSASPGDGSNLHMIGSGVSIDGVRQFRDRFVDSRLQTETAIAGRLTSQRDALAPVDAAFNESGGNGISSAMSSFFGAFQALEANPSSIALRADVVARANAMTAAFANTRAELTGIRGDADRQLRAEADQVNAILTAGRADLVAIGRPHLTDPQWTLRAAATLGYTGVAWPKQYELGRRQLEREMERARQ